MRCVPISSCTRPTSIRNSCSSCAALALEMMRLLEPFNPHLTGPVLSGSAGRYADIHLQLYTDDVKELEVFLLNREIPFRTRETRVWSGDASSVVPSFIDQHAETRTTPITVLGPRHQRQPLRMTSEGRPLERATDPVRRIASDGCRPVGSQLQQGASPSSAESPIAQPTRRLQAQSRSGCHRRRRA